eukprot:3547087-Pyramimonas_sp.AAC.1
MEETIHSPIMQICLLPEAEGLRPAILDDGPISAALAQSSAPTATSASAPTTSDAPAGRLEDGAA